MTNCEGEREALRNCGRRSVWPDIRATITYFGLFMTLAKSLPWSTGRHPEGLHIHQGGNTKDAGSISFAVFWVF